MMTLFSHQRFAYGPLTAAPHALARTSRAVIAGESLQTGPTCRDWSYRLLLECVQSADAILAGRPQSKGKRVNDFGPEVVP
jgi:hypothetical protein